MKNLIVAHLATFLFYLWRSHHRDRGYALDEMDCWDPSFLRRCSVWISLALMKKCVKLLHSWGVEMWLMQGTAPALRSLLQGLLQLLVVTFSPVWWVCLWNADEALGFFWHPFQFSIHHWSTVVHVCIKLQKFCLDKNLEIPIHCFCKGVKDGDEWEVYDNYRDNDANLHGFPSIAMFQKM